MHRAVSQTGWGLQPCIFCNRSLWTTEIRPQVTDPPSSISLGLRAIQTPALTMPGWLCGVSPLPRV